MSGSPNVGVMGAGSIGCYVGGRLLAAEAAEVTLVGRARLQNEIAVHGMTLRDLDGGDATVAAERVRFETDVEALAPCDVILCCVKSAQTSFVAKQMAAIIRSDAVVVSLQNGVRNADMLREHVVGPVLAGIVGFNVVSKGAGVFHQGTSGPIIIERDEVSCGAAIVRALRASGLQIEGRSDITPDQWTKLLVNLNNSISALSGAPTRDLIAEAAFRNIVAAVIEEGLAVLRAASIQPASLRGVPVGLMPHVLRLPSLIVRLVTKAQMRVDPHARSSMWEDLERRRATEVDYLNGEIVRVAERAGVPAPINRRIVELVREAEMEGAGSPQLSAEALWSRLEVH